MLEKDIISSTQSNSNIDEMETLKQEIYLEVKDELYNNLKAELIKEINYSEIKVREDINLLIEEKIEELTNQINQKFSQLELELPNYDLLKQELVEYVAKLIENLNNETSEIDNIESMIVEVVNKNTKAVLGVSNYQIVNYKLQQVSTGSGVIYKRINNIYYVVTNEHVIRHAKKLTVVLENNENVDATLIGSDVKTDLAVLKFTTSYDLPISTFANSDLVKRGQIAIAIGSPLGYQLYGTVTFGVVSGLNRTIPIDYDEDGTIDFNQTLIQHDVAISPGNSGGPLYNINGEIIGINNMKNVEEHVDNIGFAIPSNTVIDIIKVLEK